MPWEGAAMKTVFLGSVQLDPGEASGQFSRDEYGRSKV